MMWADSGEPVSFHQARQWKGRIQPNETVRDKMIIVSPRPAWTSTTPSVVVTDTRGVVLAQGFHGKDVRSAMYWAGGMLVVSVENNRIVLSLTDELLSRPRMWAVSAAIATEVTPHTHVELQGNADQSLAVLRIGDAVLALRVNGNQLEQTILEQNVFAVRVLKGLGRSRIAIAYTIGESAFLSVVDVDLQAIASTNVPASEQARIEQVGPNVVMLSTVEGASGTVLSLLQPTPFSVGTRSIPIDRRLVCPVWVPTGMVLAMLTTRNGRPELVVVPANEATDVLPAGTMIPGDYGSPEAVLAHGDTVVIAFSGGLVTMLINGTILSRDAMPLQMGENAQCSAQGDVLLISSTTSSMMFVSSPHPFWFFMRFIDTVLRFVVPLILVVLLGIFWLMYQRQRRFFAAMIDIPGAGLVFLLDANGRLLRTNDRAGKLLRINKSVPMRRLFRSYTQRSGLEALTQFLAQVQSSRAALSEKIVVSESNEQREYVFTSVPLVGLLGRSVGSIITGVDITEALERRRLVNWAQLAHDMQTNLSTIRLNAEQLGDDGDPRNTERRRRILFQSGVLIQRVRDLVSVGRSEDITRIAVHSAEMCTEIRHEFDPVMFPHVTFSMKLRGTMMQADRLKLSRAIRNAVENAIKSLRGKAGTVEIATWFDRSNVFVRVSDTGVGMDAETLSNMMKPYFTSAKDGSGAGIGTMIMQHVMNLHGGSLRVTSEPGIGTQVIFRIPIGDQM